MKKALSLVLAAVLLLGLMPAASGEESLSGQMPVFDAGITREDLAAVIEPQIRAFSQSINQSNADDTAATALATHGISGGGKKLSVGKDHALTATLWNSELFQVAMTEACAGAIEYLQTLDKDFAPYVNGFCTWNGSASRYGAYVCIVEQHYDNASRNVSLINSSYTGQRNSYDNALDWMAGVTAMKLRFQRKEVSATGVTYEVQFIVWDRFDFSTSQGSGFDKLISGLGALMFQEFDWDSTVTFDITVPYSCTHSSLQYHWTYDQESQTVTTDSSDGYTGNEAAYQYWSASNGTTRHYHELEKSVRLYHDKPWVMEYTVRNPGYFVIAPLQSMTLQQLALTNYGNSGLLYQQKAIENDQTIYHCYGIYYDGLLSSSVTYTFRLENEIDAQGSNIIYLTIVNADNQTTVLSRSPMDDYYKNVGGVLTLQDASSSYLTGVDLFVRYFGNTYYSFHPSYFDLKIWENGIDGGNGSYITHTSHAPTCTSSGYDAHSCAACGYSYRDNLSDALGHEFSDWAEVLAPGCEETGRMERSCSRCDETETQSLPALGHEFGEYVSDGNAACLEDGTKTAHCSRCDAPDILPDEGSALGHDLSDWTTLREPGCTVTGLESRTCARCDFEETRETEPRGHNYEAMITQPGCTTGGYTTFLCSYCADRYVADETEALGHLWNAEDAVRRICQRCGFSEGGIPVDLPMPEGDHLITEVWADGIRLPVFWVGDSCRVYLPHENLTSLVAYELNNPVAEDLHTQYPTGMKVWMLKFENGEYTARYIPEFDNLLQYAGSSIRIVGVKGIRMITAIDKAVKAALTGEGLAGYTLVEYGTALAWASDIDPTVGLVLGREYTKSNFAYRKGEADPVFKETNDTIQYTNVLVGFDDDKCIPDIAMRPYIILEDAEGNRVTLYGGTIYRSIGYIAWQNRSAFQPGTAAYDYVWGIIRHVYGNQYDADYKK